KPIAPANEPADIAQMVLNIAARRSHGFGIGRAAALLGRYVALVDALHDQRTARFSKELVVEPAHQPAHFHALGDFAWQEPDWRNGRRRMGLVEIFGDDPCARDRRRAFFHENRRGSRRIEHEELLAPLPDPLLDQAYRQPEFLEHKTDESRVRTKRMMKQGQHALRRAVKCGLRQPRNDEGSIGESLPYRRSDPAGNTGLSAC